MDIIVSAYQAFEASEDDHSDSDHSEHDDFNNQNTVKQQSIDESERTVTYNSHDCE